MNITEESLRLVILSTHEILNAIIKFFIQESVS